MLNYIVDFSIKNKLLIGIFVVALIAYGAYQTSRLPIDAVPDITNNQVQVITVAPSLGATDIERLVTFPIELANSNISGLHEIRSFSRFGLSLVTIVFNDNVDVYWARQQVTERLSQVKDQIPAGMANIALAPVTTGLGEIYQYTVRAKPGYESRYSAMDLRTIQDWMVRRQLLGVKGVADVSSFGGKLKQYEIAVNLSKLQSYGLSLNDVFEALEKNNQNTGGAYIEKGPTVLYIRSEGLVGSIEDIRSVFLKYTEKGTPLLMKDVVDVRLGYATRYGAMCYNDEGEVAGAVVMMLKGANSSEVIKNVKERIHRIQKTLPEGVMIEPFLDRTKMVNNAIGTVETNLIEGALIVLFVLIIFLGNIRAGFLVASVIPLAMLFAVIMMNTFGVIGNLMSLGALDFGLIVDGAVFIVEAVLHQLSHSKQFAQVTRLNAEQMNHEVSVSSKKMSRSVVFGQIIILIVYLPTFVLQGIEGKMFIPMAQTVSFALLGAFILSLTYVPMMSALVLSRRITHKKNFSDTMMQFLERHYQKALSKVLTRPRTIVISAVLIFAVSVYVLLGMGGEFIPALEEGDFAVETRVLTGSNLNTTIESTQKAAKILKARFPEVIQVVTKIGSGEIPTDPMPMEAADMMVILKDKKEWTSADNFPDLAEKMTRALDDVPGITVSFQYPVQMRFNELMTGAKQDVVCKIFGENMDTLARYAQLLGQTVNTVKGTRSLYVEPVSGLPQIIIAYNRALIAQYGLSINEVNRVVNTGLAGQSAGFVYEGERRFDLVVRLDGDQRKNLEDVQNIRVPIRGGQYIPLQQLARVEIREGPNQIQREDTKRRIIVGFNVRGRDVQSIVEELQAKVEQKIKLPSGYTITYGGAFENLNAAKARLSIAVPVSLLLIFLLLYFSFNSIRQGLLIYSAIPLSAIGGIFALALRGMPFSISAGVGFIALFGVAVLNGIVLIAEFNRLQKEGWHDSRKIVLMGTKIRLRPVLMTGIVASLGFLPMAISQGAGAEVQRPLATVVIGGLLIATLLTLFVLPVLYLLFEKNNPMKTRLKPMLFIAGLFAAAQAMGQTPVSLQAAIDTAIRNNLTVKHERLRSEYQKKLVKTSASIPRANLVGGYGQINSSYHDNSIGLYQTFSFPTVYSRQKQVLSEEWKNAVLSVSLKEAETKRRVSEAFYALLFLKGKEKLLLRNDSLYEDFEKKARLRFNSGESNILELTTAETQRGQIAIQLEQLKQEAELLLLQFRLLLNSMSDLVPKETPARLVLDPGVDSSLLDQHPVIRMANQQRTIALMEQKTQKARMMPDINLGYYNMSMIGNGADNVMYTRSQRFQSFQVGIGIPLFFGEQRAKIKASGLGRSISENDYQLQRNMIQNDFRAALFQYRTNETILDYYEKKAIPNATRIYQASIKQFASGEISYIDWVLLTNQAISIESAYLEALKNFNESVIYIHYLTSK
ncbi:MAG TPA: CusA/CzcA family heavy metal efflux RND transporter [Bacteroidia bacterium]|nr:CusA/CzcA family heavy metal efflux RND transporter [Bacteroidia bacterium]